jgi:hypothetical protein
VKEYKSEVDICDIDWWGSSRLVVCTGNIGGSLDFARLDGSKSRSDGLSDQKTIQILNVDDLKPESDFPLKALEASSACVVGDVLIIGSLYRNYGLDLIHKRELWQDFQIHATVHDGLLYYGAYERGENQQGGRVFGVRDPRTGKTTVLYREQVETASRPKP